MSPEDVMSYSPNRHNGFHVLIKPIGPICNLDCEYCFYLEKENLYPSNSNWTLEEEVLESFIRQYIESQDVPVITFGWQGGEPALLGVGYFRKIVELQKKYSNGKRIENTLQTNGVLLDDEWAEFLAENQFLVGLSIDGPREYHDRYRVDKTGRPSFDRVMRGMECLKKHLVEFNTLTAVQSHNSDHPLEVYRFLKKHGSGFMQFIPIVERRIETSGADGLALCSYNRDASAKVTEWSVDPLQYGKFLCSIFDEWVRKDVGSVFVQVFDTSLESWLGLESTACVFQETCGKAMALEHNGDIYSCDHFVYPENKLGNIMDSPLISLVDSNRQLKFGDDKRDLLPRFCRECKYLFACHGECPKHRFVKTPNGEPGLNYLCPGYRLFFEHIDPYMKFMAGQLMIESPPANVMGWVKEQDMLTLTKQSGRNDPCPCGSGKKYKRCCG